MKEEFNKMPYGTVTENRVLKVVEDLRFKGYYLIHTKNNFFIWQKQNKKEFIRLTLINTGWHEDLKFYWDLELSFKPFAYKHNHREGANEQSEYFKGNDEDKYFNYLLNMIDRIKEVIK